MKARWFSLVAALAVAAWLPSVGASAATPPKLPPRGTPGVAAPSGAPGTITHTRYAADGVTVLEVTRVAATASDTSASVAARLGAAAPVAVKSGAVTKWDDTGRPGAPAAQTEAASEARMTASAKRLARRAQCCSNAGCGALDVTRDIYSDIFGDWLGTFHHRVYWCWSYPRITSANVSCWSEVDGTFIDNDGCTGWGNYYTWRNDGRGGHVSYRQGNWENCVFYYGCFKHIYPWIQVWVNGNGAWAQDQGG